MIPDYHEDRSRLHVNTLANHAYFIPFASRAQALTGNRLNSERFMLLNGDWRFGYYPDMRKLPEDLFAPEAAPDILPVPSVWQNHGYDRHQYTNDRYPIPFDPPRVPRENPCGLYRRQFDWHASEGERVTLAFEGVDSCFHVWLNGEYTGFSQVSHSTSEFDVTPQLKDGENTLTVLVLKWCLGTYFEDQDKFRTSGIFRDVYLLRREAAHLADYTVRADPDAEGKAARVTVDLALTAPQAVEYTLLDAEGKELLCGEAAGDRIAFDIGGARLWNAERPYLYTLLLHCGGEWIAEKIGLRRICVDRGVVRINGVPVKFKGVNRHDSDPVLGPAVGREEMLRDLRLMKQHNVNAIRTSHYPNAPEFLRLCDEYGFYVIAEADIECHGVVRIRGAYERALYDLLANDPQYEPVFLDRVQRSVIRDKNRPSAVIWSMGNEAGHGCNFNAALAWTKAYDPTRLTHYERASFPPEGMEINRTDLDLYSRMYPSIAEIDAYFAEHRLDKPYVLCEYSHAMGNGPGDLEDYFQCFHRHEGHCGGFIWEWCDHAVILGEENGKVRYGYGGDSGEYPHDGNFCVDGLTYPDRRPHTGLIEYKNVLRPARVTAIDLAAGVFEIWNTLDFTPLDEAVRMAYSVRRDGREAFAAEVDAALLRIAPHEKRRVTLPLPDGLTEGFAVHFFEYQRQDAPFVPAGTLVGEDEAGRQTYAPPAREAVTSALSVREDARCVEITGEGFRYRYDKDTACFDQLTVAGRALLRSPMQMNIWRAPTDNDRNVRREWEAHYYDRAFSAGRSTAVCNTAEGCRIETAFAVLAPVVAPIVEGTAVWTVTADGAIRLEIAAQRRADDPSLPRFGLRLFLPREMDQAAYFGYGPYESYIDKHRSSFRHLYETPVTAMHEDYIRPQENGSRWDCSYLRLSGGGDALEVSGERFSFSASVYTQEELTNKRHYFELEPCGSTVLCIDGFQAGVGSNSCGPVLAGEYQVPREMRFAWTMRPTRR